MTEYSVEHAQFRIERRYDFPPAVVFKAFSGPAHKRKWFIDGEGWTIDSYESDFRVGGFERSRFRFGGGSQMGNDTVFMEIVPDTRIVFAYSMLTGETPFSVSLATIEFGAGRQGDETRLYRAGGISGRQGPGEGPREGMGGIVGDACGLSRWQRSKRLIISTRRLPQPCRNGGR